MSISYIKAIETENFEVFGSAREQFGFILNELMSEEKPTVNTVISNSFWMNKAMN